MILEYFGKGIKANDENAGTIPKRSSFSFDS